MMHPTAAEIDDYQAKLDAGLDADFIANPPPGSAGFTRERWERLTFGEQAYYRRGVTDLDYKPDQSILMAMAQALADTPAPSIVSGYGGVALDILELLYRRGFQLISKSGEKS